MSGITSMFIQSVSLLTIHKLKMLQLQLQLEQSKKEQNLMEQRLKEPNVFPSLKPFHSIPHLWYSRQYFLLSTVRCLSCP